MTRFFGLLLGAIGGLIATLSGLCAAKTLITIHTHPLAQRPGEPGRLPGADAILEFLLLFSGIWTVIGILIFVWGLSFVLSVGASRDTSARKEDP